MNSESIISSIVRSSKQTTYTVYINKIYFPKNTWSKELHDAYENVKVKATSRTQAAKKVWDLKGKEWLQKMNPKITKIRRISLNVDDPSAAGNMSASRLPSIEVYKD